MRENRKARGGILWESRRWGGAKWEIYYINTPREYAICSRCREKLQPEEGWPVPGVCRKCKRSVTGITVKS